MSKVKDYYAEASYYCAEGDQPPSMSMYTENTDVVQTVSVGDTVRIYDTSTLFAPKQGVVLYKKDVMGHSILDIDLGKDGVTQVYEIQCTRLSKRLPRILWLKFNKSTQEYEVSVKKPKAGEHWAKFKEEL